MDTPEAFAAGSVLIELHPLDNVLVLGRSVAPGETATIDGAEIRFGQPLGIGHKIARVDIPAGGEVFKYGAPIGSATAPIRRGEPVHLHNMKSDYLPTFTLDKERHYGH